MGDGGSRGWNSPTFSERIVAPPPPPFPSNWIRAVGHLDTFYTLNTLHYFIKSLRRELPLVGI